MISGKTRYTVSDNKILDCCRNSKALTVLHKLRDDRDTETDLPQSRPSRSVSDYGAE